jgi:hypothetical protein
MPPLSAVLSVPCIAGVTCPGNMTSSTKIVTVLAAGIVAAEVTTTSDDDAASHVDVAVTALGC